VVVNKMDKLSARPDEVLDEVFQLFESLGASDEQLDFPVVFASAANGWASLKGLDSVFFFFFFFFFVCLCLKNEEKNNSPSRQEWKEYGRFA
jgi:predicted membrane GTPase involved in stress response